MQGENESVTKKFHVVVVQNNGKEMYKKKCDDKRAKLLFCSLDLLLFFRRFRCRRRLALHDFFLFEQTINVIKRFAFSPG